MAVITYKKRKYLEKKKPKIFALKEKNKKTGEIEMKYPITDRAHAVNAKARATQQQKKGNLTKSEKKKIDSKADALLRKKKDKLEAMKKRNNRKIKSSY